MKINFVVFNTTVSVVLIPRNQMFIKSDKYFQGSDIFSFPQIWKEYQSREQEAEEIS